MAKHKDWLRFIVLIILTCLLWPAAFKAKAAEQSCLIDKLLEKEHYLRGDVNGDGKVNWADDQAIINQINAKLPYNPYDPADVNCDGKVNSDDEAYLRNYLSGKGPAPCMGNVQYCSSSPCIVRIENAVLELRADCTKKGANGSSWLARAYNTNNRKEIARFLLDIEYGKQITNLHFFYERKNSPFGLANIFSREIKTSISTPYSNEGIRAEIDNLTVLMGLSTLITAKANANPLPHSPSGTNTPVNIAKFFLSELTDACFTENDFCYQRGGNTADKAACEEKLFNCLGISGITRGDFWCGKWASRKEYIKAFIRIFNASSFRTHNESWTCSFQSQGKDIDSSLDSGKLIQNCSSCYGKDTCNASCIVKTADTTVEYPCVQHKINSKISP